MRRLSANNASHNVSHTSHNSHNTSHNTSHNSHNTSHNATLDAATVTAIVLGSSSLLLVVAVLAWWACVGRGFAPPKSSEAGLRPAQTNLLFGWGVAPAAPPKPTSFGDDVVDIPLLFMRPGL